MPLCIVFHKNASKIHKNALKIHKNASKIHKNASKIHKNASKIHKNAFLTVAERSVLKLFLGQKEHNKTIRNSTNFVRNLTKNATIKPLFS
jgi:hypothetical protein